MPPYKKGFLLMIKLFSSFIVFCTLTLTNAAFSSEHTKDTEAEIKKNLADGSAILLDVRETSEWDAGHLSQAINVPLSVLKAGNGTSNLPKDKILYLHCQSGRRVLPAADLLKTAGFDNVRALPWGYPKLVEMKFP